jgi:hypothetical protein
LQVQEQKTTPLIPLCCLLAQVQSLHQCTKPPGWHGSCLCFQSLLFSFSLSLLYFFFTLTFVYILLCPHLLSMSCHACTHLAEVVVSAVFQTFPAIFLFRYLITLCLHASRWCQLIKLNSKAVDIYVSLFN